MGRLCWLISSPQMLLLCSARFPLLRSCVGFGSKITLGRMGDSIGEAMTIFLPPSCSSIHGCDQEARYGKKRETRWTGYKVHLTETCDQDRPHLITHVATTSAPTTDEVMTEPIHADPQKADLTPGQHLLDSGYI